jgi:hypothetical protein
MKRFPNITLLILYFILHNNVSLICQDAKKLNVENSIPWLTIIIIIIAALTLIVASLSFYSNISPTFSRRAIPIDFGFLPENSDRMVESLTVSSGDEAKPINFRYLNKSKSTLVDVVIDQKIKRSLALSGTERALTAEIQRDLNGNIINKVEHGDNPERGYYQIKHIDLLFSGKEEKDFLIELNTKGKTPGDYEIETTCYSKSQNFKHKKLKLKIKIT